MDGRRRTTAAVASDEKSSEHGEQENGGRDFQASFVMGGTFDDASLSSGGYSRKK